MAERTLDGSHEGFVPLHVACRRAHRAITGRGEHIMEQAQWDAQLDTVAFSLCMVARIYATDPVTATLFPLSEVELLRGSFQGGAKRFVQEGRDRYAGLHVALADLEDAIRLLSAARTQRPLDTPITRT